MKTNWLYDRSAPEIVILLTIAMFVIAELAYRAGLLRREHTHDAGRDVFVAIKVALLGLLALLLAFAFGMAADRYAERQRLVTAEAHRLYEVHLRGSLLADSARSKFQQTFREFVKQRVAFYDAGRNLPAVQATIDRAEQLYQDLWEQTRAEAERNPQAYAINQLIDALINEWEVFRQRVHAFESRVPDAVVYWLLGGTLLSMAAVGFAGGISNHRGTTGRILLAVILGGTILVVLDLDRPRRGIFRISQEPVLHVAEMIERPPAPAKAP